MGDCGDERAIGAVGKKGLGERDKAIFLLCVEMKLIYGNFQKDHTVIIFVILFTYCNNIVIIFTIIQNAFPVLSYDL